jgi:hypothetical protein
MSDKMINRETSLAEKDMLVEKYKTALKKSQLINEIKTGLGEKIKKNPGKAKIIKKTWYQKLGLDFKNIFTKF